MDSTNQPSSQPPLTTLTPLTEKFPTSTEHKPITTATPISAPDSSMFNYQPSSSIPPFSSFFPTHGQSSSQQCQPQFFQPDPPIIHTTSGPRPQPQLRVPP